MAFVLFHGSFNSYDQIKDFWFPKLKKLNQKIIFPKFPIETWDEITQGGKKYIPKKQNLQIWLKTFDKYYEAIKNEKDLVFIGHSSGPLFILHVLQNYELSINSAIFVSPFINPLTKPAWQVKLINQSYYSNKFVFNLLKRKCLNSYVLYGTNDPYVETENSLDFAKKMASNIIPINNGGHLNTEATSKSVIDTCKKVIK